MTYILNTTYLENAIRWSSMNSIEGLRLVNTDR